MTIYDLPGPNAQELIARDRRVVSPSYARSYPFVMERGQGVEVWDVDGHRFLDFAAGIAVVSTGHSLDGKIDINGKVIDFSNGKGYIEKDWGKSFPESWIWLHCNTFKSSDASFTFSVAKIPWVGSYFIGFISYLRFGNQFYNFSTWSKAAIETLVYRENVLSLTIVNRKYRMAIKAVNTMPGDLRAPVMGSMSRIIKETVDAGIELRLEDTAGNTLFEDEGIRGGMELVDKMLDYFL